MPRRATFLLGRKMYCGGLLFRAFFLAAICALTFPTLARAAFEIVSHDAVVDTAARQTTFQVTFNQAPDFFTTDESGRRLQNQAVVAIALHADPAALDRLLSLARTGKEARLRGDALFWVAQRAGAKAMDAVSNAIENDPDTEVKKKAVFALSQMPKDEGVPKMIDVARNNRNPEVRRQAMFWLGQSGDPRALQFFEDVLRR